MNAATYFRLSASRLGADAPGLDRQKTGCERLVRERGWELSASFQDADISAWKADTPRPGWAQLEKLVNDGAIDAVVIWKLDRAFRRLKEAVDFLDLCQRQGVAFVSATEGIDTTTPFGPVLFALFSAVAQLESQTKSDRIRAWHVQRAEQGKPAGGGTRTFGWELDSITPVPEEQDLIRAGVADLLSGGTIRGVVRLWNASGVPTPTGGQWQPVTVRRIVLSPRIAGLREHNGAVFTAVWDGIISQEDHTRLRARFSAPPKGTNTRRYLLSGFAMCGRCGDRLIARPKAGGKRCYVCASELGGCGKIRIISATFEEYVAGEVQRHYESMPPEEPQVDPDGLQRQLAADEKALDELAQDRYVRRMIGDSEFRSARESLVDRIATTQTALANLAVPRWDELAAALQQQEPAPWELPPGTDPDPVAFDQWRQWISAVVETVIVGPAVVGRNFFDPARVIITWCTA